jgi:hypothetical protein
MAEDVQYQIDENAQVLIIFLREEHADSEGAILTAERVGSKITGLGSSAEPHLDKIFICFNQHHSPFLTHQVIFPAIVVDNQTFL